MTMKTFELFNKDKYIKDKIASFYVGKSKKKKAIIDNIQMKLDFDSPKAEVTELPNEIYHIEAPKIDTKISSPNPIPTIPELEKKHKLFNKDGARKRYLQENYVATLTKCAALSRTLKASGLPYLAKIVPYRGEKGDQRYYNAIIIYLPE